MSPDLMTTEEVAEFLRVTRQTVQGWARTGHLKRVKLGPGLKGAVRFRREDVMRLLEEAS